MSYVKSPADRAGAGALGLDVAEPAPTGAATCQTHPIALLRTIPIALALLTGAAAATGCGGGSDDTSRPALTERDDAGDVVDARAADRMIDDEEWDEAAVKAVLTDEQPGLDLRRAGLAVTGRTLRLRVETEGPIRHGSFALTASTDDSCSDTQLTASIDLTGSRPAIAATDQPHGRGRPVAAAVRVDGNHLTLDLPLLRPARFEDWSVLSTDATWARLEDTRFSDNIPDWYITGAYFTRGTGTPNYAGGSGATPSGAPPPPRLPR